MKLRQAVQFACRRERFLPECRVLLQYISQCAESTARALWHTPQIRKGRTLLAEAFRQELLPSLA